MNLKTCAVCGKGPLKKKKVKNYAYQTPMGIVTVEGTSEFDECPSCKEVFIPGKSIDYWNRLILGRMVETKHFFTLSELKFIFSVLPYSQAEIATATGKDRSTLTKYKTAENPIDPLFDHTLRSIITEHLKGRSDTMGQLKARHEFVPDEAPIKKITAG
jgi:hypothetical protein